MFDKLKFSSLRMLFFRVCVGYNNLGCENYTLTSKWCSGGAKLKEKKNICFAKFHEHFADIDLLL